MNYILSVKIKKVEFLIEEQSHLIENYQFLKNKDLDNDFKKEIIEEKLNAEKIKYEDLLELNGLLEGLKIVFFELQRNWENDLFNHKSASNTTISNISNISLDSIICPKCKAEIMMNLRYLKDGKDPNKKNMLLEYMIKE